MSPEEILLERWHARGAAMGCKALFTLGDRPENRWRAHARGSTTTVTSTL
jgi:hypothetical protein